MRREIGIVKLPQRPSCAVGRYRAESDILARATGVDDEAFF
jgi:hypothetical protein